MILLHIDSSPLGSNSVSRHLTERVVSEWTATRPDTRVEYLDLAIAALLRTPANEGEAVLAA